MEYVLIRLLWSLYHNREVIKEVEEKKEEIVIKETESVIEDLYNSGLMTMYTANCKGCSGITSYGYDVRNTIYYTDLEYGSINIVACPKNVKFGSIYEIKIENTELLNAICLDRGSDIRNDYINIDLLWDNYNIVNNWGIKRVEYRLVRNGFVK